MKKLLLMTGIVGLMAPSFALCNTPVEVEVPVSEVYAPTGFDSNDNSEIVIAGYLPNLCYRAPKTEFKVVGKEIQVSVKSLYSGEETQFCAEVLVPYLETVNTGVLDKGNYKVKVLNLTRPATQSVLKIAESRSSAVDENIYAAVEYVEKTYGSRKVTLKGYNPSDCMELKKIEYKSNDSNALSILPIMKKVRSFCPMKLVEFAYDFEVPASLNRNKILLHVRSMDGNSVNTLFSENY